jgi:hypothetical protein
MMQALSVKRSMSGHLRNVRQSRADGAKPDRMIVGRESGSARHASGIRAGYAILPIKKWRPLMFKMTLDINKF